MDYSSLLRFLLTCAVWTTHIGTPVTALPNKKKEKGNDSGNAEFSNTVRPELPSLFQASQRFGSHKEGSEDKISGGKKTFPTKDMGSPVQNKDCCLNGGVCVMGVFCHCAKSFYGFRCEYKRVNCGTMLHDQWARLGCNLCRCFDGQLHCLANVYSGCDEDSSLVRNELKVEDYPEDLEIFPMDDEYSGYDDGEHSDYDYYDYSFPDYTPRDKGRDLGNNPHRNSDLNTSRDGKSSSSSLSSLSSTVVVILASLFCSTLLTRWISSSKIERIIPESSVS